MVFFNIGLTGRSAETIVHDATNNRRYKLLRPIGHWDYNNITTVYEAVLLLPQDRVGVRTNYVCLKICHTLHESQWYNLACQDITRNQLSGNPNVLGTNGNFSDRDHFCVVLLNSDVLSLRSLMAVSPKFLNFGIPEDCIAIAIKEALFGLAGIHRAGELHRQITASNIMFIRYIDKIKITFGSSAFERTDITSRPDPPKSTDSASTSAAAEVMNLAPQREILKWGRAPEVVEDENNDYKIENYTAKSDIWLIGITALELAYGDIRVPDHNALLDIASCINKTRKMPNTWEELEEQTAELKTEKSPKGKGKKIEEAAKNFVKNKIGKGLKNILKGKEEEGENARFSKGFIKMVAKCLYYEAKKRPSADKLLNSKFLRNTKPISHFKDVVVNDNPLIYRPPHRPGSSV